MAEAPDRADVVVVDGCGRLSAERQRFGALGSALAAVRGLVDLPDMLSWYEGAMVKLEAVISASLTFRSGKLCDNLPVWKESRRV